MAYDGALGFWKAVGGLRLGAYPVACLYQEVSRMFILAPVTVGTIGPTYSCNRASPMKSTPLISFVSCLAHNPSVVSHTGVVANVAALVAGATRKRARHNSEVRNVRISIYFEAI